MGRRTSGAALLSVGAGETIGPLLGELPQSRLLSKNKVNRGKRAPRARVGRHSSGRCLVLARPGGQQGFWSPNSLAGCPAASWGAKVLFSGCSVKSLGVGCFGTLLAICRPKCCDCHIMRGPWVPTLAVNFLWHQALVRTFRKLTQGMAAAVEGALGYAVAARGSLTRTTSAACGATVKRPGEKMRENAGQPS